VEAVIASAIAVLGTLLGSGLTHSFQRRTTESTHRFTRDERLRQERLDAYCSYAGVLVDYRRSLVHLWFCRHEVPPPEDESQVRIRSYDLRARAQEALFRVQMLTDDAALSRTAADTLAEVTALGKTQSRDELYERRRQTKDAIDALVSRAKDHISALSG
jgi:hypothetical protein